MPKMTPSISWKMKLDKHPHDGVQVKHNIKIDHLPSEEDYGQKIDWRWAAAVVACAFFRGATEVGRAVTGSQGAGQWMAWGNHGYRRFELCLYLQVVLTWRLLSNLSSSLQIIVGAGMSDLCSHGGLQLYIPQVACCNLWATAWAHSAYAGDPWTSWR